jgi:PKD domain
MRDTQHPSIRHAAVLVLACALAGGCGGDDTYHAPPKSLPGGAVAIPISPDSPKAKIKNVQPLVVWAEGGPFSGKAPLTVKFESDLFGGTPPLTVTWDFGDGEKSSEESPTHTYTKSGTYAVRLDVSDSRQKEPDTDWDTVDVVVTE